MSYSVWLQGLISTPWALTSVAALFASSWLFGQLLSRLLKLRLRSAALEHLVAIGIGLDLWVLLAFGAGSLGLLDSASAKTSLLTTGLAAILMAGFEIKKAGFTRLWTFCKTHKWMLLCTLGIFFIILGNALCPPAGNTLDEQAYQIPIPVKWNADGFPNVYKEIPYSGYPLAPSFLLWIITAAGKITAPRLFCLTLCLLNMLCMYFLLRSRLRNTGALVLALSVTLPHTPLVFMTEVFAEPFLFFNFLCGVVILDRARKISWREGLTIGVFAGACVATKLTGLGPAGVLGLGILFRGGGLLSWTSYAAAGGLFTLPFYLRPWLLTGNPFYPYYGWLFSDNPATIAMSHHLHHLGGHEMYGYSDLLHNVLSPFLVSFSAKSYGGSWGWHFFVLFGLCLYAGYLAFRQGRRRTLLCASGFLLLYLFWLATSQQSRFLGPAVFLMTLGAAVIIAKFKHKLKVIALSAILLCASVPDAIGFFEYYVQCWKHLAKKAPPDNFLLSIWQEGFCDALWSITKFVPPGEKVMFIFEKRVLTVPRPVIIATPLYQELYFTPFPSGTKEEFDNSIMKTVLDSGANYVLFKIMGSVENLDKNLHPEMDVCGQQLTDSIERLLGERRLKVIAANRTHVLLKVCKAKQ